MKFALAVFLCIIPFVVMTSDADWELYKMKYNKYYRSAEDSVRKNIWLEKLRQIERHNQEAAAGLHTYTLGENQFSDMTWEEFETQYLGFIPPNVHENADYHEIRNGRASKLDVDLRKDGLITNVKNQGSCGSCWAFASVAALEGVWANAGNKLVTLSEQQLVDCAGGKYGNQGCQGGWMNPTFEYIRDNGGIQGNASYPYTGVDGKCKSDPTKNVAYIRGPSAYKTIPRSGYEAMKDAVEQGNPVVVAVYVETTFQSYKSGIYSKVTAAVANKLNHAITVVGYSYSSATPYFIVKNSWGTSWGESGYIRLQGGVDTAGFTQVASYPVV